MNPLLHTLQDRLGHRFRQSALLDQALTHRSFSADHYERLEFLGDSVLNLAVSTWLYDTLTRQNEGDLSRIRANLVKQHTLHQLALALELPGCIRLGEGELKSGGRQRPSILADVVEALIGAVFLDAGYDAAQAVVRRLFARIDVSPGQRVQDKDAKTALQEWLQGRKMKLPVYTVVATRGEAHQQVFEVCCHIPERSWSATGHGGSRRAAEQAAAARMLDQLKVLSP